AQISTPSTDSVLWTFVTEMLPCINPSQEAVVPSPRTQPPWEFLLSASRNSLQSYELSRLAHAANLRKEIGASLDQWMEEKGRAAPAPSASASRLPLRNARTLLGATRLFRPSNSRVPRPSSPLMRSSFVAFRSAHLRLGCFIGIRRHNEMLACL